MGTEHYDEKAPFLTDLEERRVMRSFEELFKLMIASPYTALKLIDKQANDSESYPGNIAGYYLIGLMRGMLMFADHEKYKVFVSKCRLHHLPILEVLKPEDIIGPRRKFGRGEGL